MLLLYVSWLARHSMAKRFQTSPVLPEKERGAKGKGAGPIDDADMLETLLREYALGKAHPCRHAGTDGRVLKPGRDHVMELEHRRKRSSSHTGLLVWMACVGAFKAVPVGPSATDFWVPRRPGSEVQVLRLLFQTEHVLLCDFVLVLLLFRCDAQPNGLVCSTQNKHGLPESATHAAAMPSSLYVLPEPSFQLRCQFCIRQKNRAALNPPKCCQS